MHINSSHPYPDVYRYRIAARRARGRTAVSFWSGLCSWVYGTKNSDRRKLVLGANTPHKAEQKIKRGRPTPIEKRILTLTKMEAKVVILQR